MIKVKFIQTHPDAKLPTRNNHGMLDESIPIDDSQEQATFGFYRLRNNGDTGYDLYAVDDVKIPGMGIAVHGQDLSVNSAVVPVGLKLAEIQDGYWFRIEAKHALKFLKKRGITQNDIIKYNIGFCKEGKYEYRVIIPSYDSLGKLNYFIARDYKEPSLRKYKNPPASAKDVIGWELYINWDAPIILVEGIFDALTIKRNVIPLFGKVLHDKLMKKLVESSVNRIYIALDADARKDALKQAEQLMSYGKEVYLVEMEGKDANEIGFEQFLNTIEQTKPLNLQSLNGLNNSFSLGELT